jgi:hypothetical protein
VRETGKTLLKKVLRGEEGKVWKLRNDLIEL